MDTPQQPPHAQPTRTHHHPPQPIASQSHRPCLPPPPPPPPPAPTARPQPPAQLIFPPTSNTIAQTTPDLESLRLALCPPSPAEHSPPQHPTGPYLYDQSPRHRRSLRKRSLLPRQSLQGNGSGPSADGYPSCTAVSNAILSCFPEPHTLLVQHNWSKFIWNNNYPSFIGSKFVDIYLYNANSENPVANWTEIPNDRGMIGIYADDSWFPPLTSWQAGRNLTFPYFFVITTAGAALTGGEQHQATFRVVQTAPPQAFITASLASVSSQLVASLASHSLLTPSATPNSNLQPGSSGDAFPRWEIALIVVLGSFALLIFLVAAYLAFTNARKRRQVRIWQAAALGGKSGSGGSVASHSPMIQNTEGAALIGHPKSRGGGGALGVTSARDLHSPNSSRPGSPLSAHNAPTNTFAFPPADHHHPAAAPGSEAVPTPDGPITSVDATIMADAFRKALRKPEFALPDAVPPGASARLPEPPTTAGHPPPPPPPNSAPAPPISVRESMHAQVLDEDQMGLDGLEDDELDGDEAKEIMDRELASEGRSMTSVDNRKRPQVHG